MEKITIASMPERFYAKNLMLKNKTLIYASVIVNNRCVKDVETKVKKGTEGYIVGNTNYNTVGRYEILKEKNLNSDYTHMVIKKNDTVDYDQENLNDSYTFYIFYNTFNELKDALYEKIDRYTSIPIKRSWIDYIYSKFEITYDVSDVEYINPERNNDTLKCKVIYFKKNELLNIVTTALKIGSLKISELGNNTSQELINIKGIDEYLNKYGDILCERIEKSFVPKFNPATDNYDLFTNFYDDACYYGGKNIYEAQKAVIQSVANNLKKNKFTIINGECGAGKTLISLGSIFSSYKNISGCTILIMCPSHILNEWKKEITALVPNSEIHVIRSITDLKKLDSKIRYKYRNTNLFLLISSESAKMSYNTMQCVKYSKLHQGFVCPECGQILTYDKFVKSQGRKRVYEKTKLDMTDFLTKTETKINRYCNNTIQIYDENKHEYYKKTCNAKLWGPINKNADNSKWIKISDEGWIMREHIDKIYTFLNATKKTKKDEALLLRLRELKEKINSKENIKSSCCEPRRFSIAKYIKRRYKGCIDYLILDEIQNLKGQDSDCGLAMCDLISATKKTIALTGTLINGYASSLFYLLFRLSPRLMIKNGYGYHSVGKFQIDYGVIEKNITYIDLKNKRTVPKPLPGISPLLFTDFLLDNTVFVSLSDMTEGLPEYKEIPYAVEMDEDLRTYYNLLENQFRDMYSAHSRTMQSSLGMYIKNMYMYLDMPYNCEPVLDKETGKAVLQPQDLGPGLRNKERALINLVKSKKALGEKVLVYYQYTNKVDVAEKITNALNQEGIKAVEMTSTNPKRSEDRSRWIHNQVHNKNVDVIICNPKLVETGLNLIDFVNIIFYETDYNLFTLRQASRRSYRLNQTHPINVYFMYYENTVQEQTIALMASKLQAALTLEGNFFNEDSLGAMADSQDFLAAVASSVVRGIENKVDVDVFNKNNNINNSKIKGEKKEHVRIEQHKLLEPVRIINNLECLSKSKKNKNIFDINFISKIFSDDINLYNLNIR